MRLSQSSVSTMWKKLKFEGMRYCHDLEIRPIETTLDKCIDYQSAFIKNPDYNLYIKDKQTPFFLKCFDSKVKPSSSYNRTNACLLAASRLAGVFLLRIGRQAISISRPCGLDGVYTLESNRRFFE